MIPRKTIVAVAAVGLLAGCANPWDGAVRDLRGGRDIYDPRADAARCDYEARMALAGSGRVAPYAAPTGNWSGTGHALNNLGNAFIGPSVPQLFDASMRANGWERHEE